MNTIAETPTTPTPSSFLASTVAAEASASTPKQAYTSSQTTNPLQGTSQDLRHVTSQSKITLAPIKNGKLAPLADGQKTPSGLSPNHIPAALNLSPSNHPTRLGSKSSSSIPSSPTSIHSSSSAIFERDIEPIPTLSFATPSPTHSVNSHRIPRAKATEALETSVPSVLDSAVSALSTLNPDDPSSVTVLSSAPQLIGSPGSLVSAASAGSGTSSGSPPVMSLLLQNMGVSGLVSASASVSGAASVSGFASGFASPIASSRAPSPARSISPLGDASGSPQSKTISASPPASATAAAAAAMMAPPASPIKRPSLPVPVGAVPAPSVKSTNRLSFISYTDLLTSAPIAAQPLSAVLAPGQAEPPTHVLVVNDDDNSSVRGRTGYAGSNVGDKGDREADKDIDSLGVVGLSGGEWEREKMGWGLEERLERLLSAEKEAKEATVRGPKAGRETSPTSRSVIPPATTAATSTTA